MITPGGCIVLPSTYIRDPPPGTHCMRRKPRVSETDTIEASCLVKDLLAWQQKFRFPLEMDVGVPVVRR